MSRRELREAERKQVSFQMADSLVAGAFEPNLQNVAASVPVPQPEPEVPILTRRELRERDRAASVLSSASDGENGIFTRFEVESKDLFVSDLRASAMVESAPATPTAIPGAEPWSLTDTGSIFTFSPLVGTQPQAASIVIEPPADPLLITGSVTASGELIMTGSITLPSNSTLTGESSLVGEATRADQAMARDSAESYVSGIPPVASAGVIKSRSKEKSLPVKVRRGQAQVYLVLTTALLMAAVAGLAIAAFMLGIFN
jgi:hypothetical protein